MSDNRPLQRHNQQRQRQSGTHAMTATPLSNYIQVSVRQNRNPLLTHMKVVPWQWNKHISVDFEIGPQIGILYLSVKYHLLHPKYIHGRISMVKNQYSLRVLLLQIDQDDSDAAITALTAIACVNRLTIVCVWTLNEAARYIESYKTYENKSVDSLKGTFDSGFGGSAAQTNKNKKKSDENNDFSHRFESAMNSGGSGSGSGNGNGKNSDPMIEPSLFEVGTILTEIRSVNKTDVATLMNAFGSLAALAATADEEQLCALPGLGKKKVKHILDVFNQPLNTNIN